jgi:ABC-type transport system involved in multi-copper enzyme maturation permease subunit
MSRRGGDPLSLGPVFAYEWLTASRRWQGYALRSLFVLLLLVALVVVWASQHEVRAATTIRALAQFGQLFYIAVVGTQLTLVLLAAPAATAGAICLDWARGTLVHLLVTDLSDRELVLGKLAARLVPVLGLVGCTLPVMAILTLLGGVDPDALIGAFAVTLGIAVLGCCLALAFSLQVGKTHEALLGTYAVWALWLLGAPMIHQLNQATGWTMAVPPWTTDPFALAFAPYWWPGTVGPADYLCFLGTTWAISAFLVIVVVLRLRSICRREQVRRIEPRDRRFGLRMSRLRGHLDLACLVPCPPLDLNPVFWREWHRSRPSRLARIVGALFVTLATLFSLLAIATGRGSPMPAWVNALQCSVGLLLLSVTAATALAEERVRGSLDLLLATPLSARRIVLGKWLGTFRLVPPLAILPGLVILGAAGTRVDRWLVLLLTTAFILSSGAAVTSLGLALATWSSRLGRAVGLTVTLYVLVTVGWLFLVMMIVGPGAEGPMMASPFFGVGEMTDELYSNRGIVMEHLGWAMFWTMIDFLAAAALLFATLASFNRCLGRVETGLPWLGHRDLKMKRLKAALVEEIIGESIEAA